MQLPVLRAGGLSRGHHPHLSALGHGISHLLSAAVHAGAAPVHRLHRPEPDGDSHGVIRDYPLELGEERYLELGCLPPSDSH